MKQVQIKLDLDNNEGIVSKYRNEEYNAIIAKLKDYQLEGRVIEDLLALFEESNKESKKYRVIDLFSGCGGISVGFEMNDEIDVVGAIDFNKSACVTYEYNFPKAKVINGDIKAISVESTGFKDIDIIIGGPPCQGFSSLNRHQKLEDDPRNVLFFEFLRFVKELRPKAILIENVKQILTKNGGYAKNTICSILDEIGYNVDYKIINASDYGVPQNRERAVFIGIRKDIGDINFDDIVKFQVSKKTTVREALEDLYDLEDLDHINQDDFYVTKAPVSNDYLKIMRNSTNYIFNHKIRYQKQEVQDRVSFVPQGGNWKCVPDEYFPSKRNNRHSNYLRRFDENSQSTTIDTGHDVYYHPLFNRPPTVRESARLQSFPDRFIFVGSKNEQLRQVGNAVPPLMAFALSKLIVEVLDHEK